MVCRISESSTVSFQLICLLFYHPGVPLEYPHQGSDFAIGDAPMSMFQVLRLHEKDMINLTKSKVHSVRLTVLNDFGWHPWIAEWLVGYFHHRQEGCIGVKTMLPNHCHPRKQTLEPKNHPFGKGKSSSKPSLFGFQLCFPKVSLEFLNPLPNPKNLPSSLGMCWGLERIHPTT